MPAGPPSRIPSTLRRAFRARRVVLPLFVGVVLTGAVAVGVPAVSRVVGLDATAATSTAPAVHDGGTSTGPVRMGVDGIPGAGAVVEAPAGGSAAPAAPSAVAEGTAPVAPPAEATPSAPGSAGPAGTPATPASPEADEPAPPTAAAGGATGSPVTGGAPGSRAGAPVAAAQPAADPAAEDGVLTLVNAARAEAGCGALAPDEGLAAVARAHSADMRDRDYFSHTDPDGLDPFDRAEAAGIDTARAENIAYGQADAQAVVTAWLGSEGHRANILDCDLRTMGVGVAEGPGGPWWTQLFGA
ncbi:CAP domain-containing protein [Geodermatophilus sp. SYSU D00758]